MTTRNPPRGTANGTLRWYVHRKQLRPARFGETHGTLVWAVVPIINGRGSLGIPIGTATLCGTREAALIHAHRQAIRTYGPKDTRS